MALEAHIAELNEKHLQMKRAIERENRRPNPDHVELSRLKREKLMIKDEIAQLQDKLAS